MPVGFITGSAGILPANLHAHKRDTPAGMPALPVWVEAIASVHLANYPDWCATKPEKILEATAGNFHRSLGFGFTTIKGADIFASE